MTARLLAWLTAEAGPRYQVLGWAVVAGGPLWGLGWLVGWVS